MSDHNKRVHIVKVPLSNSNKKNTWNRDTSLFSGNQGDSWTLFNSAILEPSGSIPGHTGGRYVCAQVHSSGLFLTLITPGLIQVSPLLARRCFKLILRWQDFPLRTLSSCKQHRAKPSTSTFCSVRLSSLLVTPQFSAWAESSSWVCNWLCSSLRWTYNCFCYCHLWVNCSWPLTFFPVHKGTSASAAWICVAKVCCKAETKPVNKLLVPERARCSFSSIYHWVSL